MTSWLIKSRLSNLDVERINSAIQKKTTITVSVAKWDEEARVHNYPSWMQRRFERTFIPTFLGVDQDPNYGYSVKGIDSDGKEVKISASIIEDVS